MKISDNNNDDDDFDEDDDYFDENEWPEIQFISGGPLEVPHKIAELPFYTTIVPIIGESMALRLENSELGFDRAAIIALGATVAYLDLLYEFSEAERVSLVLFFIEYQRSNCQAFATPTHLERYAHVINDWVVIYTTYLQEAHESGD